jgi:hypothetical protein
LKYKFLNNLEKYAPPLYKIARKHSYYYPKISSDITDPNHILYHSRGNPDWVTEYFQTTRQNIIKNQVKQMKRFEDSTPSDLLDYRFLIGGQDTNCLWAKLGDCNGRITYSAYSYPSLVKYAYQIPRDIMFKTPRNIFHQIAKEHNVPDFIFTRKKMGFNPIATVPKGFFDPLISSVSNITSIEEMNKMKKFTWNDKRFWALWYMINYSIWKHIFLDDQPANTLIEEIIKTAHTPANIGAIIENITPVI